MLREEQISDLHEKETLLIIPILCGQCKTSYYTFCKNGCASSPLCIHAECGCV